MRAPIWTPSVEQMLRLQATAGNHAVGRVVGRRSAGRLIARLRTAAQLHSDSKVTEGLVSYGRSDEFKAIEAALAAYDLARGGTDLQDQLDKLDDLERAIWAWQSSKSKPGTAAAWRTSIRGDVVDALEQEVKAEIRAVSQAKADADAAAKAAALAGEMDKLVSASVKAIPDPAAKARAVFKLYMRTFRGKAQYRTTTPKHTTVWDRGGEVACSMISRGLVDLLRHVGLRASVHEIARQDFVTKRLDDKFIDPGADGNIRPAGGRLADERRYFFNRHWVVEVEDGALYLDPTSGIEVSKDASEIVDWEGFAVDPTEKRAYDNGTWHLSKEGNSPAGDAIYRLTPSQKRAATTAATGGTST